MGLFGRKKTFTATPASLNMGRVGFYKPTPKELKELRATARLKSTPHISARAKKKLPVRKSAIGTIRNELKDARFGTSSEYSHFGSSYNSSGHLGRNLNIRI